MARKAATTEAPAEAPAEVTFSAKDLASELGIDPKAFRRWLRSQTTDRANKGGRWLFDAESKAAFLERYRNRSNKGTKAEVPADA